MSEHEPDIIQAEDDSEATQRSPRGPRWKRALKRIAIGVAVLVTLLVVSGVVLCNFGGPSGSVYPGMGAQYEQLVTSGQAAPLHRRFVIPIPGCQCHSKDPVLTAQHSVRHMSECGKCHSTNPAHMEPGVL